AVRELRRQFEILTGHEVEEVEKTASGHKRLTARDRKGGRRRQVEADEILIATGRGPITEILHPEKAKIDVTKDGWIAVNEYLETSQPNVWAFGDADGSYLFKHVANYESEVIYYNAVLKRRVKVDYHAITHAVFSYPDIANLGLKGKEAEQEYGNT